MNRYHSQYLDLMKQIEQGLDETASRPSKLKTIIDNLVTASLWNSRGKINWKHPSSADNVPDGWTILAFSYPKHFFSTLEKRLELLAFEQVTSVCD